MYQIGDLIIYNNSGVCRVLDITTPEECASLSGMSAGRKYYILEPLYKKGTVYAPADPPKAFMRPVISKEEAEKLISLIPAFRKEAYYARNLQTLRDHYRISVNSHSCEQLIGLTSSIYEKRESAAALGRKLGQVDQKYMQQAEEQLFGELAAALGIPVADVPDYIAEHIEEEAAVS
ncbi:MAG: CarD family transcriptional regulator [Eubacteriales bacterium]|nr:CarD family transcriptional regulator [Eubacteriales bacterium]